VGRDAYEPLTAQDRAFLVFEDRNTHMHLGGLALFDGDPLVGRNGAIAIDRIRAHIASCLHVVPRYRQRLAWVPMRGRAVWVDESHFNLEYHVRHTAVPRPGGEPELRELASRIMSQQLDRGKPLWELWVITGLRGGRFGVLVKSHHALADGIAAFDLFAAGCDRPDREDEGGCDELPDRRRRAGLLRRSGGGEREGGARAGGEVVRHGAVVGARSLAGPLRADGIVGRLIRSARREVPDHRRA
jgi:WS/DGAT/MGAT family acyltransferase